MDFGFHSFGRETFIPVIHHACRIASAPIKIIIIIAAAVDRSIICSDRVQIMLVRSRSVNTIASCLSRDRRSDRSSLIAEKSRSTLTSVSESTASAMVLGRTAVGGLG